jgi:hypothetical protein
MIRRIITEVHYSFILLSITRGWAALSGPNFFNILISDIFLFSKKRALSQKWKTKRLLHQKASSMWRDFGGLFPFFFIKIKQAIGPTLAARRQLLHIVILYQDHIIILFSCGGTLTRPSIPDTLRITLPLSAKLLTI